MNTNTKATRACARCMYVYRINPNPAADSGCPVCQRRRKATRFRNDLRRTAESLGLRNWNN